MLTVQRQVDENNVHSGGNRRLIRHQQDGPKPSEAPPCLEISDPSPVSSGDRLQVRRGEQVGEGLKKKNQEQRNGSVDRTGFSALGPNLSHRFWVSSGFLKTLWAVHPSPPTKTTSSPLRSLMLLNRTAVVPQSL